jgi:hypothetical protein
LKVRDLRTRPRLEDSLTFKVRSALNKGVFNALLQEEIETEINNAVREFTTSINFLRRGKDP